MDVLNQKVTEDYAIYNGDSTDVMTGIPDNSIDYSIYSPPFQSLYVFSDSERDVSNNSSGEQFWEHYQYIIKQNYRITKPGRLVSVHCINLPATLSHDGFIGLVDFRGDIIRKHLEEGFIFHSEVVVWKNPVVAMQRTKSIRLLHKQVKKDSSRSGMGIPDYILTFRKQGENETPIAGRLDMKKYAGERVIEDAFDQGTDKNGNKYIRTQNDIDEWSSINIWQQYASPVWDDIRQGNVLNKVEGRHEDDEKHITPLQLDVIERCLQLWSLPGETVFTPFLGIGSEVYQSIKSGRKGIGIELKESYYNLAVKNVDCAVQENKQMDLFE